MKISGAGGGIRTHMEQNVPLDFESSASANFATPACFFFITFQNLSQQQRPQDFPIMTFPKMMIFRRDCFSLSASP